MFFRRRSRHPLPKFPGTVADAFHTLCREIGVEQLDEVRTEIEKTITALRERVGEKPNLNLPMAEEIAARCFLLLDRYPNSNPEERRLIVGAISYFVIDDDCADDDAFATGFDDDARVMNHVLERLGIENQFIDVRG